MSYRAVRTSGRPAVGADLAEQPPPAGRDAEHEAGQLVAATLDGRRGRDGPAQPNWPFSTAGGLRHWRELPFASLPAILAVHQFIEAVIWARQGGDVSAAVAHVAVLAYLLIALPLLPTLFPLSVLLLEPHGAQLRVAPFVVLGVVVSTYLAIVVLTDPVGASPHPHCMVYQTGVQNIVVWAVLYVVAVVTPALMSGYPSIVAFGALNLVGLIVVVVLYVQAFASLWCIYAAAVSALVLVHMVRRRRLPDPHRYHGVALLAPAPARA